MKIKERLKALLKRKNKVGRYIKLTSGSPCKTTILDFSKMSCIDYDPVSRALTFYFDNGSKDILNSVEQGSIDSIYDVLKEVAL